MTLLNLSNMSVKYSIGNRAVKHELKKAIIRHGLSDSFIVIEDTDRLGQIERIKNEEIKQMKLQTLYLYRLAVGDKEYTKSDGEYQAELSFEA